tara:strand:- start:19516 stop:19800 length:285 start_codon:yes stop_codon:yes gene_type:complete
MEPATHSLLAAGAIAAFIRAFVPVLKSKRFGEVWQRSPKWLRPAILMVFAAALALCDSFLSGMPVSSALLAALAALGGAVGTYETQKGVSKSGG